MTFANILLYVISIHIVFDNINQNKTKLYPINGFVIC